MCINCSQGKFNNERICDKCARSVFDDSEFPNLKLKGSYIDLKSKNNKQPSEKNMFDLINHNDTANLNDINCHITDNDNEL